MAPGPFWDRFLAPTAHAILDLLRPRSPGAPPETDAPFILEELVEAVLPDGRYRIGGDALATKGRAALTVGQRVHVLWQAGRRQVILTHRVRRAQPGGEVAGAYAVEELFLLDVTQPADPGQRWDVYFRNDQQVTRLDLRELINADRVDDADWSFGSYGPNATGVFRVGWGQADHMFWVWSFAARLPLASPTPQYYPRFYVFQLSRPEGEPAGGAPVSATSLATVEMPQFTLPEKYNTAEVGIGPVWIEAATIYPDDLYTSGISPRTIRHAEPILARDNTITLLASFMVGRAQSTTAGVALPILESAEYVFAVRSDAAAIIWESAVTDQWRGNPPPITMPPVGFPTYSAFETVARAYALVEWSESRKRVGISWQIRRVDSAGGVATVAYAQRGVFIEDGTATPAAIIQPWTDFATDASGAESELQATPLRLPQRGAEPTRLLLVGIRRTQVSPAVVEARVEMWESGLTLLGLDPDNLSDELPQRAQALRLFAARTTYVVAEHSASATAGAWPSAEERGRFTLLTGEQPLDIGKTLAEDGAHQGPLRALPEDLTEVDPLATPERVAYHVVGTIT